MPTEKQAIAEAVKSLDPSDDLLWTDDGSPMIDAMQKLCNDTSLTRAQINDALPGWDRKTAGFAKSGAFAPPAGAKPLFSPEQPKVAATGPVLADHTDDPPMPEPRRQGGVHLEDEEARQIHRDRLTRAEERLIEAKRETSEARAREVEAEQSLSRVVRDFQRKFPPITQEANIKAHLEAQGRLAMENAGLTGHASPLDARMSIKKRLDSRTARIAQRVA